MLTVKKILAPTDFSEASRGAVRMALEIARSQDAEITVFHVIGGEKSPSYYEFIPEAESPTPEFVEERKRALAAFLRENFADLMPHVKIHFDIEVGQPQPHRKIIDRAIKDGADLIVMSTHGESGLLYALIGGVTEKVVRLASCPVLSVRPDRGCHKTAMAPA